MLITRGQSLIWRPGEGITLNPFSQVAFPDDYTSRERQMLGLAEVPGTSIQHFFRRVNCTNHTYL